jgi:hypothetical protein
LFQAGLAAFDEQLTREDIQTNSPRVSKVLANQKPLWEPGSIQGYHAITFGIYIDQIVRRIDPKKRNVTQFFEDEIAKPLGNYIKEPMCIFTHVIVQAPDSSIRHDCSAMSLTIYRLFKALMVSLPCQLS